MPFHHLLHYTQFGILVHVHSDISVCYAMHRIYRYVKAHTYILRIYNTVLVFNTVLKENKKHPKTLNYSENFFKGCGALPDKF